ncbi:histidine phosphatase family protein [Zophobihabitans entericus]|uniref:Histidine phosphatase family protein n=1 Tax=Zophobihabitans entericus TaxID=1635327 RepID=A0A6G9ICA0_9GAMM|nr:histidine phosphatase family protein [Zophobihabitans entericus]QIQ21858.1 histidine phosphatase family protein [Zophobihabitans entericus]
MKDLNLYLVRHGETEWNLLNQMQGSQNSPLTEKGIAGAKTTGKFLANVPFVKAYSSNQKRAIETRDYILAERADKGVNVPRKELPGFAEMDFGSWEGVYVPDLAKLPEFQIYLTSPENYDPTSNQGEWYLDVLARMKAALEQVIAENSTGDVLIVSHGSALRILLHVLRGGDWREHREEELCPRILNTSISLVNYKQAEGEKEGTYTFQCFNDVSHLE